MLPIRHVLTKVPLQNGSFQEVQDRTEVFIDPARVDTLTAISEERRKAQPIPGCAQCIIRYVDVQCGYRLIYVEDTAKDLARSMYRMLRGEDPRSPDFGMIPDGI